MNVALSSPGFSLADGLYNMEQVRKLSLPKQIDHFVAPQAYKHKFQDGVPKPRKKRADESVI